MDFKYKTSFSFKIKPLISEEKDMFLSQASLVEIGKFIPKVDAEVNVDLLPVAFNAFVANRFNKNDDGIDSATAVSIAKYFINKPINIGHKRDKVIGVILNYAFTKFGTNEEISLEEAEKMEDPFNVTLGGVLWKLVNKRLTDAVEESSDPTSEHYEEISASWELGFMEFEIAKAAKNSKNLKDATIISDEEEQKKLLPFLKASGGRGQDMDGNRLFRKIINTVLPFGVGLTDSPAAEVQGIATEKTLENAEEAAAAEAATKKEEKSKENISQTKENIVIQERKAIANMKITKIEDITDEALKEAKASEVTEWVKQQLQEASDAFVKEKQALANQVQEANEKATEAAKEQARLTEELKKVSDSLAALEKEKNERIQQDKFNTRMSEFDSTFNLNDAEREVIASEIANISDESFEAYKKKLEVLLAAKKKGAKAEDEEEMEHEEDNKDCSCAKCKAGKKEAKASAQTQEAQASTNANTNAEAAVSDAIDNGQKEKANVPNTTTASDDKGFTSEKYKKAFGLDQWVSDIDLTN